MTVNKKSQKVNLNSGPFSVLLTGTVVTTLVFWTTFQDPFNSIKLSAILLTTAWLIGHVISGNLKFLDDRAKKLYFSTLFAFVFCLGISALTTDVKVTAFVGENQRNNGWLFYFGLTIISLTASAVTNFDNISRFFKTTFFILTVLLIYGFFQFSGNDFVRWINPYNSILLTVGNPNYSGALLAILSTLIFGNVFNSVQRKSTRAVSILLSVFSVALIFLSNARQGLIAILIGYGFILLIVILNKNRRFGFIVLSSFLLIAILIVLGMLQKGPLVNLVYKESVSIRGYYWRAGIEMFLADPINGVGVDRYGVYFKQFREIGYSQKYGFDITSTNAHNVPIQFFATAGIFVGVFYLVMCSYILWRGIIGLKRHTGNTRIVFATVFAGWLAYQATSLVSIDSPGIAIWGWMLSGVIVGLSFNKVSLPHKENFNKTQNLSKSKFNFVQPAISTTFAIVVLLFSISLYRAENSLYTIRAFYNPQSPDNSAYIKSISDETIQNPFLNPTYRVMIASYLATSGYSDLGISQLEELLENDPRNLDALDLLATYYVQLNKAAESIELRKKITLLDPYNAKNFLALGNIYKSLGDYNNMETMKIKILEVAPASEENKLASEQLRSS
jgi:hypothetical protein